MGGHPKYIQAIPEKYHESFQGETFPLFQETLSKSVEVQQHIYIYGRLSSMRGSVAGSEAMRYFMDNYFCSVPCQHVIFCQVWQVWISFVMSLPLCKIITLQIWDPRIVISVCPILKPQCRWYILKIHILTKRVCAYGVGSFSLIGKYHII